MLWGNRDLGSEPFCQKLCDFESLSVLRHRSGTLLVTCWSLRSDLTDLTPCAWDLGPDAGRKQGWGGDTAEASGPGPPAHHSAQSQSRPRQLPGRSQTPARSCCKACSTMSVLGASSSDRLGRGRPEGEWGGSAARAWVGCRVGCKGLHQRLAGPVCLSPSSPQGSRSRIFAGPGGAQRHLQKQCHICSHLPPALL